MLKNNYLRKALIVQIIFVLLSVSIMPKRADAFAPAIPVVAIGAYVLGAAGIAAIAYELGYVSFSEDAYLYSEFIWKTATDSVKNSIVASYNEAVAAGKKYITLSDHVVDYLKSKILNLTLFSIRQKVETSEYIGRSFNRYAGNKNYHTYEYYPPTGYYFYDINGYTVSWIEMDNYITNFEGASVHYQTVSNGSKYLDGSMVSLFDKKLVDVSVAWIALSTYISGTISTLDKPTYDDIKNNKVSVLEKAISTTVALPMPGDFVAHPKKDKTKTAVQNPDTGAWTLPDGSTVAEGDLTFDYPIPKVTDGVLTIPIGGVQVDAKTGEKVGDIAGNPPLDWGDTPSDTLNFGPLRLAGNLFTTKFPFSIPWDIQRQFSVFNVEPKPAILKVDKTIPIFNTTMKLKFDIDFTIMEPAAVVVRWFAIIAFDLGMILSIRKFMPE